MLNILETIVLYTGAYTFLGFLPAILIGHIIWDTAEPFSKRETIGEIIAISPVISFIIWVPSMIILAVLKSMH